MNLVAQFLAVRRDKLLMKVGCWLVCFSLVLGLMFPQQRAEAVGTLTIAAVASVAAAYLGACGMTFITQGMDKDALVSTTQRLIQEFLDTELGGITIQEWLGSVWNVFVLAGKIVMGRPLTEEMMDFAQWVVGKYATQVGENAIYNESGYFLSTGEVLTATTSDSFGTKFYLGASLMVNGHTVEVSPISEVKGGFFIDSVQRFSFFLSSKEGEPVVFVTFYQERFGLSFSSYTADDLPNYPVTSVSSPLTSFQALFGAEIVVDLSIDRAPSMSYIPEGIAAEQGIALDVGAASTMDLDQVLQGVLDDVLAGTLESTMAAVDEKTEPVDPPAEELPDVGELGLPALGAALTSRFPFSIPWDFFRAVQLLAAPAKAPYFEVDFMEPLADDVGGWQGDTMVVLDFSEYAIIGQISRWTSTIGFCLMLAGATKRLIWTA